MWTRRGWRTAFLLGWGLLWAAGGVSAAGEQAAADKAAQDKVLFDALKDMHNRAADLYNAGDHNGAYRMFQGGLLMARPFLAQRPEIQQVIDKGMQEAERQASISQRAHLLHKTIEDVRNQLKPPATTPASNPTLAPPRQEPPKITPTLPAQPQAPPPLPLPATGNLVPSALQPVTPVGAAPPPTPAAKSLWERLGGETNVTKIVDNLITLTIVDKSINLTRDGKYPLTDPKVEEELKRKFVGFISELSNGTVAYTGKSMADAHQLLGIKDQEFDTFLRTMRIVLSTTNVSAKDADELLDKIKAMRKDFVK